MDWLDDERRRFLFNIHGDAGVGKTYLMKKSRQFVNDGGVSTAYTDETVEGVTSAMTTIAGELGRGGAWKFEKRVAAYRQRRQELESDPHGPEAGSARRVDVRAACACPGNGQPRRTADPARARQPPSAPKPGKPGAGRPPGSKSRRPPTPL